MSFASKVKKQVADSGAREGCCMTAEAYGLLLFSRLLSAEPFTYRTAHHCVAQRTAELIAACCGVYVKVCDPAQGAKRAMYTVEIPYADQRMQVLEAFNGDESEFREEMLKCEGCKAAFIRGAFLAAGTVSDPDKGYHLEIASPDAAVCKILCTMMQKSGIKCSTLMRKKGYSAYIRSGEDIETLLGLLGAGNAYMEFIDVKIYKNVRNQANRCANCDAANIAKTVTAASQQLAAIRKLESIVGLGTLPDELRELAILRLDNPEMTLRELGESLDPPLSRSGVNHRIQRLIDMAEKL